MFKIRLARLADCAVTIGNKGIKHDRRLIFPSGTVWRVWHTYLKSNPMPLIAPIKKPLFRVVSFIV